MRIVRVIPPCFSWSTYKEEDDDDDKERRFKRRAWIGLSGVFSLFFLSSFSAMIIIIIQIIKQHH